MKNKTIINSGKTRKQGHVIESAWGHGGAEPIEKVTFPLEESAMQRGDSKASRRKRSEAGMRLVLETWKEDQHG